MAVNNDNKSLLFGLYIIFVKRLAKTVKAAVNFFQSAIKQTINKSFKKNKNDKALEHFYADAPQHWLDLIKRNRLSLHSFNKRSIIKSLKQVIVPPADYKQAAGKLKKDNKNYLFQDIHGRTSNNEEKLFKKSPFKLTGRTQVIDKKTISSVNNQSITEQASPVLMKQMNVHGRSIHLFEKKDNAGNKIRQHGQKSHQREQQSHQHEQKNHQKKNNKIPQSNKMLQAQRGFIKSTKIIEDKFIVDNSSSMSSLETLKTRTHSILKKTKDRIHLEVDMESIERFKSDSDTNYEPKRKPETSSNKINKELMFKKRRLRQKEEVVCNSAFQEDVSLLNETAEFYNDLNYSHWSALPVDVWSRDLLEKGYNLNHNLKYSLILKQDMGTFRKILWNG